MGQRIRFEQTKQYLSQVIAGLAGELALGVMALITLWVVIPSTPLASGQIPALLAWGSMMLILIGTQLVYSYDISIDDCQPDELAAWLLRVNIVSVASGIMWGAMGAFIAFYGDPEEIIFCGFLLVAMMGLVFASRSMLPVAFMGFIITASLPPAIAMISSDNGLVVLSAGILLLALLLMIVLASRSRYHLARLSMLGIENTELLQNLAVAKEHAQKAQQQAEKYNESLQDEIGDRIEAQKQTEASEKELSSILNNVHDTIFRIDMEGMINWVSPSVEFLLGHTPEEVERMHFNDIFIMCDIHLELFKQLDSASGIIEHHLARMERLDGEVIWVSINAHFIRSPQGGLEGVEGTIRDITELKNSQETLYQLKGRAQITLEAIGDGVITTDVNAVIDYMNPAAENYTGWSMADTKGVKVNDVLELIDEKTKQPLKNNPIDRCLRLGKTIVLTESTILHHHSSDTTFSVEVTASPIRDTESNITGSVLVFHDVTKLRNLAKQMWYQATHDPLTGLMNRRAFENQLKNLLGKSGGGNKRHCLCYLDLDQFKVVNDTCGHIAGDDLLKGVTATLSKALREADVLARLGGDEFAVILKGCPLGKGEEIAENLRAVVENYRFYWKGKEFRVGASIGVVPITEENSELTDVLSAADSAMYVAKEEGRNRVHVFQADDTAVAQRHGEMQWKQRIQKALDEDNFRLMYQPIVPVDEQEAPAQGEILLRMVADDSGLILPAAFMPSAERYHLMPAIDRWVIKNVFNELREKKLAGEAVPEVSINLSGQTLSDEIFLDFVLDRIEENNISPGSLCFEITETAVMGNISSAMAFILELRGIGCRFALDDFGSGMSSFSYLKNLPVDYIKIDGSFIVNLVSDAKDRSVVKAINEIGQVMNMQTIAECVEDAQTLNILKTLKINYAQGFAISRPVYFDTFKEPGVDDDISLRVS